MTNTQTALLTTLIALNFTGCVAYQKTTTNSDATNTTTKHSFFPEINHTGSIPPVDADFKIVKSVTNGMSKNAVYSLIGRQHYKVGFNRNAGSDWDYLFNFKNPDGKGLITCQFKVLFTEQDLVKSTHWNPESCPALVASLNESNKALKNAQRGEVKTIVTETIRLILSADGLFEFDQYSISSLKPGAKEKLDQLIEKIQMGGELVSMNILGHTDRLGSESYNLDLSASRANTIKNYLINAGVRDALIKAEGHGERLPVVECKHIKKDKALINCLEPNRRFEIEAVVIKKSKG